MGRRGGGNKRSVSPKATTKKGGRKSGGGSGGGSEPHRRKGCEVEEEDVDIYAKLNRRDRNKLEKRRRKERNKQKFFEDFDQILQLSKQLRPFHLVVRDVRGDGNCLFRAISDQFHGSEAHHQRYRAEIVAYIQENPDWFKPFIETEEESFEDYLLQMSKLNCWGGNMELQAASMRYEVNFLVHQLGAPCLEINNFPGRELLQLGYFTEEHYASVRPLSESTAPLVSGEKDLGDASRPKDPNLPQTLSEQIVVESTNCRDFVKIRKLLQENWDNADTVVQILWDEQIGGDIEDPDLVTGSSGETVWASQSSSQSVGPPPPPPTNSCSSSSGQDAESSVEAKLLAGGKLTKREKKLLKRENKRKARLVEDPKEEVSESSLPGQLNVLRI